MGVKDVEVLRTLSASHRSQQVAPLLAVFIEREVREGVRGRVRKREEGELVAFHHEDKREKRRMRLKVFHTFKVFFLRESPNKRYRVSEDRVLGAVFHSLLNEISFNLCLKL